MNLAIYNFCFAECYSQGESEGADHVSGLNSNGVVNPVAINTTVVTSTGTYLCFSN